MVYDLPNLGARLQALADATGSVAAFARLCGMPQRTMANYVAGEREPRVSDIVTIASCAGVSVEWLATGEGPMHPDDAAKDSPSAPPTEKIDEGVMGRLNDGISAVYKDLGQAIAPIHLGRLAARLYNEVTAAADKPEEVEGAIKMRLSQLRAELRAAEVDPLKGKRSA